MCNTERPLSYQVEWLVANTNNQTGMDFHPHGSNNRQFFYDRSIKLAYVKPHLKGFKLLL
jgi:hypothetical protein